MNTQPTVAPSREPSHDPSHDPSQFSSHNPTKLPSNIPSALPTMKPSLRPTIEEHYVGDYKISAINASHGNWLLCDGSFIDSTDYPHLFDIIGHSFGSFSGYPSLFQLPNVTDDVVGIAGNLNEIGSVVGKEDVILTEDNLPSHWHYLAQSENCNGDSSTTSYYLADGCFDATLIAPDNKYYAFRSSSSNNPPDNWRSGSVGNGESVNIMQPTVFVGNLFIYAE